MTRGLHVAKIRNEIMVLQRIAVPRDCTLLHLGLTYSPLTQSFSPRCRPFEPIISFEPRRVPPQPIKFQSINNTLTTITPSRSPCAFMLHALVRVQASELQQCGGDGGIVRGHGQRVHCHGGVSGRCPGGPHGRVP